MPLKTGYSNTRLDPPDPPKKNRKLAFGLLSNQAKMRNISYNLAEHTESRDRRLNVKRRVQPKIIRAEVRIRLIPKRLMPKTSSNRQVATSSGTNREWSLVCVEIVEPSQPKKQTTIPDLT